MTQQHDNQAASAGEPEDNTSGFAAEPELTVEDVLNAPQNEAAQAHSADSEQSPAAEAAADAAQETSADAAEAAADDEAAATTDTADTANPYLEDLRRLTAEYANYRKRTEDNAQLEKQRAAARVITPLLSVLDDFERAAKHGDLPEGSAVAAIANKLQDLLAKQGLEAFGAAGEVFDPLQHEAIAQVPHPDAQPNTILDVVERGYRLGSVELRPAKVAVVVAQDG